MKYLQVVTFTGKPLDTGTGRVIVPRSAVQIVRSDDSDTVEPEDGGEEPIETDTGIPTTRDELQEHDAIQAAPAAHRERYRLHYASGIAMTEATTSAEGVQALVEVKNDMDRVKQRLRELEELADSMDYDFKLSYQVSYLSIPRSRFAVLLTSNECVVYRTDTWRRRRRSAR